MDTVHLRQRTVISLAHSTRQETLAWVSLFFPWVLLPLCWYWPYKRQSPHRMCAVPPERELGFPSLPSDLTVPRERDDWQSDSWCAGPAAGTVATAPVSGEGRELLEVPISTGAVKQHLHRPVFLTFLLQNPCFHIFPLTVSCPCCYSSQVSLDLCNQIVQDRSKDGPPNVCKSRGLEVN